MVNHPFLYETNVKFKISALYGIVTAFESQGSSISVQTRLDDQGSVPGRGNDGIFSLHHCIQTSPGTHPTSCAVGTGRLLPW
jgi:hypothetical protein